MTANCNKPDCIACNPTDENILKEVKELQDDFLSGQVWSAIPENMRVYNPAGLIRSNEDIRIFRSIFKLVAMNFYNSALTMLAEGKYSREDSFRQGVLDRISLLAKRFVSLESDMDIMLTALQNSSAMKAALNNTKGIDALVEKIKEALNANDCTTPRNYDKSFH